MASAVSSTKHLLRASLRSTPANGYTSYVPQCRKIVLSFCQRFPSSTNTRTFLLNDLERIAKKNPHVEFVVKQRNGQEPVAQGFYVSGRDKVIPLNGFEPNGIEKKINLLLDSSGAKITHLKRGRVVESSQESARGIWSGMHVDKPFVI
ncbi:mitochondrial ribosomal protein subunit L51 [Coniophora puteana RWD-64-598 SS2]|uniref:Large ribosomal subunit protein mL43 n=1 Tax=Coniophora puteana (strain RWD-64-598) TaxID=741705 RepID=A0A5M3N4Z9_CONPW|nr:mitochondrial ribosomal protein subunit L51 [Coniophora puteana RWD-64-598 SS2]EIW86378.1 mitochondrial ribosomal protein subunit L51 [Coniophora puteana RWD-64-598 SS2]